MSKTNKILPENAENRTHTIWFKISALLGLVGLGLCVGYGLSLSGFAGWITLAVAGATLVAAVALWFEQVYCSVPAVVVALVGAILCTMALPNQLNNSEFVAALANLAIIASLITAAAMILRQPAERPEM